MIDDLIEVVKNGKLMCSLWEKLTGFFIVESKSIDEFPEEQKDLVNLLETARVFSVPSYRLFSIEDIENKNITQIRRFFSFLKRYRRIQAEPEKLNEALNSV